MTDQEILAGLADWDEKIRVQRSVVEDAKLDLETLSKKKRVWLNLNCPHKQTYQRSVMGKEYDRHCSLCELYLP